MVAPGYGYGIVAMAALGYGGPWLWWPLAMAGHSLHLFVYWFIHSFIYSFVRSFKLKRLFFIYLFRFNAELQLDVNLY